MNILGIIPARYASTRFPGKPLIDIGGKSMIRRVYEQAKKCSDLNEVVIATDDDRIYHHVVAFGGKVVMTKKRHPSGTDRCAEVALKHPEYEIIINIQGDEPFIDPAQISEVANCFNTPGVQLATLIKHISDHTELLNPATPKVVIDKDKQAIYFSRTPIPYLRDVGINGWLNRHDYYKHIGIYGYRNDIIQEITALESSLLEEAENLEQLRWLENGYSIQTAITKLESQAVDVPEDLNKLVKYFS